MRHVAWRVGPILWFLAACYGSVAIERIVIVSPHNEAIRTEFSAGFAAWHRARHGVEAGVEWRDVGGTSDSLRFVLSEFEKRPQGIGIDLFFGGGSEPYLVLAERGLCEATPVSPGVLAGIPQSVGGATLYDPQGRWYGAALSSFGILQNRRVQRTVGLPEIERWDQLADPRLYGWVGAGDPRNSGTMNNMYEAFLQAYGWQKGWELLTEIAGNTRYFDRLSSTTAKDAALGDTAFALAIDFYAFTQIAAVGRSNLTFVLPADFGSVSPDGIAVLKGAPRLALAQRFVEYVLDEPGQSLWFLPRGHPQGPRRASISRMSVRPDFYTRFRGVSDIESSPFENRAAFGYDARLAQRRREVVAALFGALLVDLHAEVKRTWRALIARGLTEERRREFGRTPLSEAEAIELAATGWKDPGERNVRRREWQRWADAKYHRLQRGD